MGMAYRAQGYNGASNMSGRTNGVKALVRNHSPDAVYVHCKAHCLNLAIMHSCKEPVVRTMMATVQEIAFASDSYKLSWINWTKMKPQKRPWRKNKIEKTLRNQMVLSVRCFDSLYVGFQCSS